MTVCLPNSGVNCAGDDINVNLAWLASLISIVMGLKELYQLFSVPTFLYYFSKLENLGQLLLIVIVALTTLPVWTYLLGSRPSVTIQPWQYQAAAVSESAPRNGKFLLRKIYIS